MQKNLALAAELTEKVKTKLKTENEDVINGLVEEIVSNEEPDKWLKSVNAYIKNPVLESQNDEKIEEISVEHQTTRLLSALLFHSQKELNAK